jgi:hypothetical protein
VFRTQAVVNVVAYISALTGYYCEFQLMMQSQRRSRECEKKYSELLAQQQQHQQQLQPQQQPPPPQQPQPHQRQPLQQQQQERPKQLEAVSAKTADAEEAKEAAEEDLAGKAQSQQQQLLMAQLERSIRRRRLRVQSGEQLSKSPLHRDVQ